MTNNKSERIRKCAEKLYISYGFHGASMQMIAQEAKISVATIYTHFENKETLIRTIYRQILTDILSYTLEEFDTSLVPFEQFRKLWLGTYHAFKMKPSWIYFKNLYENSPFYTQEDFLWTTKQYVRINDYYQRGINAGTFRNIPPHLLLQLSLGFIFNISQTQRVISFDMTQELENEVIQASWQAILA
jgi:Transcriptional regulator